MIHNEGIGLDELVGEVDALWQQTLAPRCPYPRRGREALWNNRRELRSPVRAPLASIAFRCRPP